MSGPFMSLLNFFIFVTYLCPTACYLISHIEMLQKTTCEAVYKRALGSRKEIDFSKGIGNLSCSPGPNGFIRYHCMVNEDGHNIQFCAEWIWIESGLCPQLYSLQGIINPKECGGDDCPADKYQSHMYYNYSVCFVKEHSKNETAKHNTPSTNIKSSNPTVVVVVLVAVVLLLVLILAAGIGFYVRRRKRKGTKDQTDTWDSPLLAAYNFRQTKPFESMEKCVKQKRHIVLTGLPGSGVSTLLEQMRDSHQGKRWHTEKHGELHFESRDAKFIVLDQRGLLKLIRNHSPEDISVEMAQVLGKTTVIINVDYEWYTQSTDMIQRCLGKTYTVIDLSSEKYRLNNLEKRQYLDALCDKNDITEDKLPEEKRQVIASYKESSKGFLLLCLELINSRNFDNPQAYLRMKDSRKDVLEQDRPLNAAKSKLDVGIHVLVTGLPGSGTSTFLEHLKRKCQNWQKVKYKTLRFNKKRKGVVEIDPDIVKDLMKSDELNKLKDRILDAPGCAFIMSMKYEWYREYVDKFRDKLEIRFDVIDLSSDEYKLNNEEKLAIVDKLCSDKGISIEQLSNEKRQEISSFGGSYCGFLQVLKEFLEEEEFENPIKRMEEIDEQHKG